MSHYFCIRMKKPITILFFLINILSAQTSVREIDSINAISIEFILSNTRTSIKIFTANRDNAKSIGYKKGEAKSLSNVALAEYIRGNYDKSTENYLDAIQIYDEINDFTDLAEVYGEFGYQLKRRDMKKAEYYMKLGMKIARDNNIPLIKKSKLFNNYGVLKEMQNQLDSASFFYNLALDIVTELDDSLGIPFSLTKIAGVSALKGNFKEAFRYLGKADKYRDREKGNFGRAENLSLYGDFYKMQGKPDSAIEKYEQCLKLSRAMDYKYLIQYCYQKLSDIYSERKDFEKSLKYYKNYTNYKDSLTNFETNSLIAELEIDYESAKKDKIIVQDQLEIKQKSFQLFIAGTAAFILLAAAFLIYFFQKQKRKRIRNEFELESQIKTADLENRHNREKLRISRELHDNIGSQLTFFINSIDNLIYSIRCGISPGNNSGLTGKLENLNYFGRGALDDLRTSIWALKNEDGDSDQLIARIRELIKRINNSTDNIEIKIKNNLQSAVKLTSEQMLNIFRIVQEAVQNAVKYADAGIIEISFSLDRNNFIFGIKDDGKGFSQNKNQVDVNFSSGKNGLKNMEARCREMKGKFEITTSAADDINNTGVKIECSIKVK